MSDLKLTVDESRGLGLHHSRHLSLSGDDTALRGSRNVTYLQSFCSVYRPQGAEYPQNPQNLYHRHRSSGSETKKTVISPIRSEYAEI